MSLSMLPRDQLVDRLTAVAGARLRLVSGPPGSGKSSLLRQLFAATAALPDSVGVWCDVSASMFVPTLARCFLPVLGRHAGRISRLDSLLDRLAAVRTEFVVYLDGAHRLAGRPAERTLTELINEAPPNVRFAIASRSDRVPDPAALTGLSVHRIGYPELKFRTWDVERLFRDIYRSPLTPEAAATLCARVDGWPVAVGLFHVDTVPLSSHELGAAVHTPVCASVRLRDYLATEVLGVLPEPALSFATNASVLGVLEGQLCDLVLDRSDSADLLSLLAEGNLVVPAGTGLRFHIVLQQYLERCFAELKGPHLTRQAYYHAAVQLLTAGHWAEAYRCYARAGDWVAAAGVLHRFSAHPGGLYASAAVPAVLLDGDPWIALAEAKRLRGEGRLAEAYDRYLSAEDHLTDQRLRWQCALERSIISRWISRDTEASRDGDPLVDDVSGHVLEALRTHPAKLLIRQASDRTPAWTLGRAAAALLDGRPDLAVELAAPLACDKDGGSMAGPPADAFVSLAGRIIVAAVGCVHGSRRCLGRFAVLAAEAEAAGWPWLARVARAAGALAHPDGCADAEAVLAQCQDIGDVWGVLVAGFLLAVGCLRASWDAAGVLAAAVARARQLGVAVAETWLQLLLVGELERQRHPSLVAEHERLDRLLGEARLSRAPVPGSLLAAIRAPLPIVPREVTGADEPGPPVAIRCLGRYQLSAGGREVDLSGLRRQARQVLHILSLHCGHPVHEERLVVALWPNAPLKLAKHRLQVAISSLRTLLRPALPEVGDTMVGRYGNAYLLRLPPGSTVDVVEFADALRRWRDSRGSDDHTRTAELAQRVLELYRGELLCEEGPAEWVLARRDALRGAAAGVGIALARLELDRGNATAAGEVCQRTLEIDELDGRVWTLLAEVRRLTGGSAPALRTQQVYRDLVAE